MSPTLLAHLQDVGEFLLGSVGTASVVLGVVYAGAQTKLGTRIVSHYFDRKLQAYKHAQDQEVEGLKARFSHLSDRGVRWNEREYDAISATWEQYVDSYLATLRCLGRFSSYPDLHQLSAEDLGGFLDSTEFSEQQKKQVRDATDKNRMFSKITQHRDIAEAGQRIAATQSYLHKKGIFMPESLKVEFSSAIQVLWDAQIERYVEFDFGHSSEDKREATKKLLKNGQRYSDELETKVRARLFAVSEN
jgi:hypothetical protein